MLVIKSCGLKENVSSGFINSSHKMKRLFALPLLVIFASPMLIAQDLEDSLRYAESIWSMKKKAMILEQMDLTEAEKSSFWPVYESYSNAVQYLDLEYLRLLNIADEERGSEKQSASLTENMLMNDLLLAKARKYYFRKFRKALSPGQASKFMQLDNSFRTMLRLETQKNSPAFVSSVNRIYSRN